MFFVILENSPIKLFPDTLIKASADLPGAVARAAILSLRL
jgi:hypothetical protein